MTKSGSELQRDILPIPDRDPLSSTTFDARDPHAKFQPIHPLRPPAGAPNIVIALIDDVGFGASSPFGGPVHMPTAERLAAGGLKYTRFHTTALCSPTRAALLTGRNHHSVGMGGITEIATSAPGCNSLRPNTKATLAETLRLNGYATAHFGKCHEVPVWETSPVGPFDHWPTPGGGFEHFYGFIGGETNQYFPAIHEGTTPVQPSATPEEGYHFTKDMTDKAITWAHQSHALQPDRPFFLYWAPGATHAPHHVPREWADKYKGKFDDGWDELRKRIFARQKSLGVIPANAVMTKRHEQIPSWDSMNDALLPVLRREMEIYAGYLEHTDFHFGRLLDSLKEMGILENTLIFLIIGDNGASAEGTLRGSFNEGINFNGMTELETAEFMLSKLDEFGGPSAYNHYAVGWAHALCTPYQWTKQVASHFGGTRNGTIVHWPRGIRARGELRHQFHHVIDIAPTVLEAAALPHPSMVHGVLQAPIEGISMAYTFNDARAADRHTTQYFEIFGNRAIYDNGWTAVTKHLTPWELLTANVPALDDDVWELYDTAKDWTQSHDLAKEQPEKLHELQRLWLIEAARHNVLPIDDGRAERFNPDFAGRPTLITGNSQVLYPGMGHLNENCIVNIKNKSHSVTAEVVIPKEGANGVLLAQGGSSGGWTLYFKDGKPKYCYNLLGLRQTYIEAERMAPQGKHLIRMEFVYDGGGLARGGRVSLFIDRKKVGEGHVDITQPLIFSADETTDVGKETGSMVTPDYGTACNEFTGKINWIQIHAGNDSHDHLISPEDHFRITMARQ